jgi:hypothetical protein
LHGGTRVLLPALRYELSRDAFLRCNLFPPPRAAASLPLMMQDPASASTAAQLKLASLAASAAPAPAAARAAALLLLPDNVALAGEDAAAAAASVASTGAAGVQLATAPPAPATAAPSYSLGPLKTDVKGPSPLTAPGQAAVLRLRAQLEEAQKAAGVAPDEAGRAAGAAKVRFIRQQLAAVQSGFLEPSAVGGADVAAPQCNALNRQCGGLNPGSNTEAWAATSACCGNATCVQTDPNFAQCLPLEEVRKRHHSPPPPPAQQPEWLPHWMLS